MNIEDCTNLLDKIPCNGIKISNENIFAILNKVRDERTHCRILRYLIFYYQEGFLSLLSKICHRKELKDEKMNFCKCESHCDTIKGCDAFDRETGKEGSIDILIETDRFYIPIELKVGAEDQELQLLRYYEYLKTTKPEKELLLIYITPSGRPATEYSTHCSKSAICTNNDCTKILGADLYFKLGFQDLSKWLQDELDAIKNKSQADFNVILMQHYREILEQEIKSMGVVDEILKSMQSDSPEKAKNRFYAVLEIRDNFDKIVDKIINEFFDNLQRVLKSKNISFDFRQEDETALRDYRNTKRVGRRDGKIVCSLCIDTNLYIRRKEDLSDWSYITPNWFDEKKSLEITIDEKNSINGKKLGGDTNPIVQWYFSGCNPNSLNGLAEHIQEYVETALKE